MTNSANPNGGAEPHALGWPDRRRMVSCLVIDQLGFGHSRIIRQLIRE
jgi:hypothetical protein